MWYTREQHLVRRAHTHVHIMCQTTWVIFSWHVLSTWSRDTRRLKCRARKYQAVRITSQCFRSQQFKPLILLKDQIWIKASRKKMARNCTLVSSMPWTWLLQTDANIALITSVFYSISRQYATYDHAFNGELRSTNTPEVSQLEIDVVHSVKRRLKR